ncbi:suppressor of fused domain protein [Sphingomonas sp. PB4P5]|uniref:suppressor of fused domain protein n=1 Tax=Parasphingomonas puruogangriensis TaxID=3096155 RepID=UPI002FC85F8D
MTWQTSIENHCRYVWHSTPEQCEFTAGPTRDLPEGFVVLRFPPHGERTMWTYATRCMSSHTDANPIELHLFSPWQADELVELLVVTAHFHRTAAKLDVEHSVNFGRAWIGESKCSYGLISLPYLDGPTLETLTVEQRDIKFYWLIPVTFSEVEYKKADGLEALEEAFEQAAFDYLDPQRGSVV